jgi:ubiquinone/menaquinone biosynthesis C-methylase UbiE
MARCRRDTAQRNYSVQDPTRRFSDRVSYYAKFRPGYPEELLAYLGRLFPLSAAVADIGSGTGILTRQLLDHGYTVYAVEPNEPMRAEAERALKAYSCFHSVNGRAEATRLPDRAIDLVTCAQAFHWFDRKKSRSEFCRILKPDGATALIWNERRDDLSDFAWEYNDLLHRMVRDYRKSKHRRIRAEEIHGFFAPNDVALVSFQNFQDLDREGFKGRLLSSSYVPIVGQPGHEEIVEAAEKIFDKYEHGGKVTVEYETKLYLGRWHLSACVSK